METTVFVKKNSYQDFINNDIFENRKLLDEAKY